MKYKGEDITKIRACARPQPCVGRFFMMPLLRKVTLHFVLFFFFHLIPMGYHGRPEGSAALTVFLFLRWWRERDFFLFLSPVPIMFPLSSAKGSQVTKMFPKMFPIAFAFNSHVYKLKR
jgi:hypothetical protein